MKLFFIFIISLFLKKDPPNIYVLISMPKPISGCGGILFAGEFLFIDSKDSTEKIAIILCPGDNFKEDHKYKIDFLPDSVVSSDYSMMNVFDVTKFYIAKRVVNTIEEIK
ncbi:MAG: hypothetical protein ABIU77_24515 [Ferruginibacter sp.]